jgi:hypothetical protein
MKKGIVISLVALLVNSVGVFISAQTLPPATEKDFTAAYDASVGKTIATFPDLPGIAIVVIKDDKPIFLRAYGMADKEARHKGGYRYALLHRFLDQIVYGAGSRDAG